MYSVNYDTYLQRRPPYALTRAGKKKSLSFTLSLSLDVESFEFSRSLIYIFTMAATKVVNGDEHTLTLRNAVSLTEYSAHPLPSLESVKPEYSVPPAYLMSDGYPDVGTPHSFSSLASNF